MTGPSHDDRQSSAHRGIPARLTLSAVTAGLVILCLHVQFIIIFVVNALPPSSSFISAIPALSNALSSGFVPSKLPYYEWSDSGRVWPLMIIAIVVMMAMYGRIHRTVSVGKDAAVIAPILAAWHLLWLGFLLDDVIRERSIQCASTGPEFPYDEPSLTGMVLVHFGGLVVIAFIIANAHSCRALPVRWAVLSLLMIWLTTAAFPVPR